MGSHMTAVRPVVLRSDEDMTLDEIMQFARQARIAGATGGERVKVRAGFRGGIRQLEAVITLEGDREAAYQRDQGRLHTGSWRPEDGTDVLGLGDGKGGPS